MSRVLLYCDLKISSFRGEGMKILRNGAAMVVLAAAATTHAHADAVLSGTWALEAEVGGGAYMLASSGAEDRFLICFSSGNVRSVVVATGGERSALARGSCTVFAPSQENGIVVDFASGGASADNGVALGTFVIVPDEDEAD